MASWVIVLGRNGELSDQETPHRIVSSREYLALPELFTGGRPNIINLASSYAYQSRGYYVSLLAAARGHRVLPAAETILDLSERRLYRNALPELEAILNQACSETEPTPTKIRVYFGFAWEHRFEKLAKLVFDWFRAPALELILEPGEWTRIRRIKLVTYNRLNFEERKQLVAALAEYTKKLWRDAKPKSVAKYSIATLVSPAETLPPSSVASLKHWARIAARMGVDVSPISKRELAKLANYDALFIRETTSISNHTYRFARRAEQENMPVIDDTVSMIRCTNKVYLHELMGSARIPMPKSRIVASPADLEAAAGAIGFPLVIKIPDSSFSRGVKKVDNPAQLKDLASRWLKESDLLICQEFLPTEFDWRVGILDGKPLFVTQYLMAKKHWQIIRHDDNGRSVEGGFRPYRIETAPSGLIAMAAKAAGLIGDGLYGVDIKETADGYFVIEINDNPNLDHGVEDAGDKDAVWVKLTRWFIDRLER